MRRRYALPLAALRFAFPSRVRFAFAFGVLITSGARAQQAPAEIVPLGTLPITLHLCTLPAGFAEHEDHVLPLMPPVPGEQPLATFQVTYTGFTPEAQAAFQYAVDIWAQHVVSSVPIKVQANWVALGPGVLGSAGSNGLFANFSGAPLTGTWYANALADAISGQPLDPSGQPNAVEINANFSNAFNWYYGTDGNTPISQYDLVTVVLHELGHGLGFFGRANLDDGAGAAECSGVAGDGCLGVIGIPVIWDRLVEDLAGNAGYGPTYPNPGQGLGTLIRSNNLFMDGPTIAATLGDRAKLYAPGGWTPGSSYSHLDESFYDGPAVPQPHVNALMTPQVANGQSLHLPGPATCAVFSDLGWPMGPGCLAVLPTATESAAATDAAYTLGFDGPNPVAGRTALRLEVREAQAVRAELVDVTGRTVAVLHDGDVAAGRPVRLDVDAGALAPGVYVVRVVGAAFAAAERLVVAR
ncbi:MAG TPA: hypothetical protein VK610_07525 [Rhodothermales bacterium]|nr:hypothetical protein [Rhodothermales bacterium]